MQASSTAQPDDERQSPDGSAPAKASGGGADDAITLLYNELRAIAAEFLRHERPGHVLQTTALVHEAYLRLSACNTGTWSTRAHFCSMAARMIRRVLIDEARTAKRAKRGGAAARKVALDSRVLSIAAPQVDLLILDEALTRLAALSERQALVVELRFFGGLEEQEVADSLGVSRRTVQSDWRGAQAWLRRELADAG